MSGPRGRLHPGFRRFGHPPRRRISTLPTGQFALGRDRARARQLKAAGYQPCPFGCKVGSQCRRDHVSRGPPAIPEGRISRFRFWPWLSPRGLSERGEVFANIHPIPFRFISQLVLKIMAPPTCVLATMRQLAKQFVLQDERQLPVLRATDQGYACAASRTFRSVWRHAVIGLFCRPTQIRWCDMRLPTPGCLHTPGSPKLCHQKL
jgi:hypothetical protein